MFIQSVFIKNPICELTGLWIWFQIIFRDFLNLTEVTVHTVKSWFDMNDFNSSTTIAPNKSKKIDYNNFTWPKTQLAFVYDK